MPFKASEASCNVFSEDEKFLIVAFLKKTKTTKPHKYNKNQQKVFLVVEKPGTASFLMSFYLISSEDQERRNLAIDTPAKRNK